MNRPRTLPPMTAADFGAWVRSTGYTHAEVGAVFGVPRKTVSNWIQGQAKLPQRVADYLAREGVPVKCANPPCPNRRAEGRRWCHACKWYWDHHHQLRPAARCQRQPLAVLFGDRCANPVCDQPRAVTRGCRRCVACDAYFYKRRRERPIELTRPAPMRCAVPDCRAVHHGRGYCKRHFLRWWRRQGRSGCTRPGCARSQHAGGLCPRHYTAAWRAARGAVPERSA